MSTPYIARHRPISVQILIVDDSDIFREGLRTMIEIKDNWEVVGEAADGLEAIQKARQLRPDLIIMDLSMPRMAGMQAACEILKDFPAIPILLLTLHFTGQLAEEAREVGIRATMSKTDMHRFENVIEDLLPGEGFATAAV
jgi:DNA-binding NarL/FixJ family response regulator